MSLHTLTHRTLLHPLWTSDALYPFQPFTWSLWVSRGLQVCGSVVLLTVPGTGQLGDTLAHTHQPQTHPKQTPQPADCESCVGTRSQTAPPLGKRGAAGEWFPGGVVTKGRVSLRLGVWGEDNVVLLCSPVHCSATSKQLWPPTYNTQDGTTTTHTENEARHHRLSKSPNVLIWFFTPSSLPPYSLFKSLVVFISPMYARNTSMASCVCPACTEIKKNKQLLQV